MSEPTKFRSIGWHGDCPHCGKPVTFRLQTDLGVFQTNSPDNDWYESLSRQDRDILALAESTGVFASYQHAAHRTNNPRKTFLRFLRAMKLHQPPDYVRLALQGEFPNSKSIAVYTCGDMSLLAINGQLSLFLPTYVLFQKAEHLPLAARTPQGTTTMQVKELARSMRPFHEWVKTRMGYVPASGGMFLQEMRKRCYGAFGVRERAKGAGA